MSDNPVNTRHHYIPQFYLRGFSIPEREENFWVYDLGNKIPYAAKVATIAQERGFYTAKLKDGTLDAQLETRLSEIEGNAAPVIKKVRTSNADLVGDEFYHLMLFAAHMFSRVPFHRNWVKNFTTELAVRLLRDKVSSPGFLEKQLADWEAEIKTPEGTVEEFRKYLFDDEAYSIEPHPNLALIAMSKTAVGMTEHLLNMKWIFARTPGSMGFVTSDNPFIMVRYSKPYWADVGILMKDVQVTLPLSSELCLIGGWSGEEGYITIRPEVVEYLNKRTILFANKYVFASGKDPRLQSLLHNKPLRARVGKFRPKEMAEYLDNPLFLP